tara:strand:+ start:547 stop:948 length:402 start_codon:yes stop_codon:yes gene_type:complete
MNHFKLHNIVTKDNEAGNIIKFIDIKSKFFDKFGEIYFSEVNYKMIKGWKLHKQMQMNICVPAGEVKFVLFCNEKFNEIILNKNSFILTIYPNTWFAFQGMSKNLNLVTNFSNIVHSDEESITKSLSQFNYEW